MIRDNSLKYIKCGGGRYRVRKVIGGKEYKLPVVDDLEVAVMLRDEWSSSNWDLGKRDEIICKYGKKYNGRRGKELYPNRYIHKRGESYVISKENPYTHRMEHYGTFHSLNDARIERDFYEEHDWNWDEIDGM